MKVKGVDGEAGNSMKVAGVSAGADEIQLVANLQAWRRQIGHLLHVADRLQKLNVSGDHLNNPFHTAISDLT
ncbi:hypothetical protein SESBI_03481 [Sesbania bispinosa]|nr:hypothetical protein SESBI_03481 [Sesbania bispinosa]